MPLHALIQIEWHAKIFIKEFEFFTNIFWAAGVHPIVYSSECLLETVLFAHVYLTTIPAGSLSW